MSPSSRLLRRIAYHEAGHAVAALALGGSVTRITLSPPECFSWRHWQVEHVTGAAGAAAEHIRFPRVLSQGSGLDFAAIPARLQAPGFSAAMVLLKAWWPAVEGIAMALLESERGRLGQREIARLWRAERLRCPS